MSRSGVEIPKIIKQGHLKTSSNSESNSKTRLVVLGEKRIAFYDDSENEKIIKDEFYLRRESKVEEIDSNSFKIIISENSEYLFALCDDENLKDWVNSINSVIKALISVPDSHYFIPNLLPISAQASDLQLPKGFPRILMESFTHKKANNERINDDVFRPEDLVEWVDESSMEGMFNPVRHIKVPEYKCREHPWGKGVTYFLKFDLLLSEYIKKATTNIKTRLQSRGQKLTGDLPNPDEANDLFCEISSMFSRANSEFEDNPVDSAAEELGLSYLWTDTESESEFENKWRNWVTRYNTFLLVTGNYFNNGVDYILLIVSKFDDAIQHFIELKDNCVKQIQEGITFNDFSLQKVKVLDLFFPDIKDWPPILTNYNQEMQVFMPNALYVMMKNLGLLLASPDYLEKKDDNLEVFHYCEFVMEKHKIFIKQLLEETKKYIVEVTAAIVPSTQVPLYIDAFRTIEPSLTQQEMKELRDRALAVANKTN